MQGITWRLGFGIEDPTQPEGTYDNSIFYITFKKREKKKTQMKCVTPCFFKLLLPTHWVDSVLAPLLRSPVLFAPFPLPFGQHRIFRPDAGASGLSLCCKRHRLASHVTDLVQPAAFNCSALTLRTRVFHMSSCYPLPRRFTVAVLYGRT